MEQDKILCRNFMQNSPSAIYACLFTVKWQNDKLDTFGLAKSTFESDRKQLANAVKGSDVLVESTPKYIKGKDGNITVIYKVRYYNDDYRRQEHDEKLVLGALTGMGYAEA